jgi:hypothetical protein
MSNCTKVNFKGMADWQPLFRLILNNSSKVFRGEVWQIAGFINFNRRKNKFSPFWVFLAAVGSGVGKEILFF